MMKTVTLNFSQDATRAPDHAVCGGTCTCGWSSASADPAQRDTDSTAHVFAGLPVTALRRKGILA